MAVYRSAGDATEGNTEALVIHCASARYQRHFGNFIDGGLRLGRYCRVAIPGGVHALVTPNHLALAGPVVRSWVRFLVRLEKAPRVVLIGHEDCAWYTAIPKWLSRTSGPERIAEDLKRAAAIVRRECPGVRVECFYARGASGAVEFHSVG